MTDISPSMGNRGSDSDDFLGGLGKTNGSMDWKDVETFKYRPHRSLSAFLEKTVGTRISEHGCVDCRMLDHVSLFREPNPKEGVAVTRLSSRLVG